MKTKTIFDILVSNLNENFMMYWVETKVLIHSCLNALHFLCYFLTFVKYFHFKS